MINRVQQEVYLQAYSASCDFCPLSVVVTVYGLVPLRTMSINCPMWISPGPDYRPELYCGSIPLEEETVRSKLADYGWKFEKIHSKDMLCCPKCLAEGDGK